MSNTSKACYRHPPPALRRAKMRCAKSATLPQHRCTATALLTRGRCLCSWGRAACAAAVCTQLQCQSVSSSTGLFPQSWPRAAGCSASASWAIGLRKGQVQVPKGSLCRLVSSGVLLPFHQRINHCHHFAATWQFARDWEGLQSNSVMVKHPSFWVIA